MNNWIPKNKIVRFAAAAALLSIAVYCIGLLVVFGEINKVENFYLDTESATAKEQKILAIKSVTETNKEDILALRNFFIQKGDEVKFIEQIESVAKASSVKFEIVSIDVAADKKDLFKEDVDVKTKVEGSWKDTMLFLDGLEKMSFGVSIEKVDLDANIPGSWTGPVEFTVFREK